MAVPLYFSASHLDPVLSVGPFVVCAPTESEWVCCEQGVPLRLNCACMLAISPTDSLVLQKGTPTAITVIALAS
jgi:hypothetical protein